MNKLLKTYEEFILESISSPTVDGGRSITAIAFLSASASETNITAKLAQSMGVELNKKYTFTIRMGLLSKLADEGKFGVSIPLINPVDTNPGEDSLIINGKSIMEKGVITVTGTEIANNAVQITAAGNGLLVLLRMGTALREMRNTTNIGLGVCKNWAMKFSLGASVTEKDARGFSFWAADPSSNMNSLASTIALAMSLVSLKATGNEAAINTQDSVNNNLLQTLIGARTPEESVSNIRASAYNRLNQLHILTNPNPGDATATWKTLQANLGTLLRKVGDKLTFTTEGLAKIKAVISDIINSMMPPTKPAGFGPEADPIFAEYVNFVKTALNNSNPNYFIATAQIARQSIQLAPDSPAKANQTKTAQGEGQFKATT